MRLLGVKGALRDKAGKLVPIYSDEPPAQLPNQPDK